MLNTLVVVIFIGMVGLLVMRLFWLRQADNVTNAKDNRRKEDSGGSSDVSYIGATGDCGDGGGDGGS